MTIPKLYGYGKIAQKLTEKLASCLGMFSVQKVCTIEQLTVILTYKSRIFCLVLEFHLLLFYRSVFLILCLRANIKIVWFSFGR